MDHDQKEESQQSADDARQMRRTGPNFWVLLILLAFLVTTILIWRNPKQSTIDYTFLIKQIKAKNVAEIEISEQSAVGKFKVPPNDPAEEQKRAEQKKKADKKGETTSPPAEPKKLNERFSVVLPKDKKSLLDELNKIDDAQQKFKQDGNSLFYFYVMLFLIPLGIFIFFWMSLRRRSEQMMGGGFLSGFTKSPAKLYDASRQQITFKDVAGLEHVKEDLQEIVDYLKNPERFQKLGGRVPKGVLLNGPPGTGKTLLARAVAGESDVPFFSVNGSEFIQMFVGVGASRVRDLFKTAKEQAPGIMFIDEIDAVGRQRGAGLGGGHDEREQTLNQILSEMDGFSRNESVIVMAATNRPDVLDPALLRPGRFDRHITVDRPAHKGRREIFKVHVRDVPLAEDVDLDTLASGTVGLTGADIQNLVNEAALWAARQDKSKVDMKDFDYAFDKVLMGAKREEVLQESEKEKTAYHEAGHTLLGWVLPGVDRVHKVTIVPRGRSLGVTQFRPSEDRLSTSKQQVLDHLTMALGGRAAEKLIYDETTAGAENDLERATSLARRMVTHWGMSDRLGPVSFKLSDDDPFLGREISKQRQFSEHTMEIIDEEVSHILHEADHRAQVTLRENREKLETLTRGLIKKEVLDASEIRDLIGPSVHDVLDAKKAEEEKAAEEQVEEQSDEKTDEARSSNADGGQNGEDVAATSDVAEAESVEQED